MNGCSNGFQGVTECSTTQIIEPDGDLLVETSGSPTSDMEERGFVNLAPGQTSVSVVFEVPKLNATYHFEYLYIDDIGDTRPGAIQIVPSARAREGFTLLLAGAPIQSGYVLHWRVSITQTAELVGVDTPEVLYLPLLHQPVMGVFFHNPRSGTNYGFSELRVENLTDPHQVQAIIHVQVVQKTTIGFTIAVNPMPPTGNYFLAARTP